MKIVIGSAKGESLGLAKKLRDAGHEVMMAISNAAYAKVGEGIITRVPNVIAARAYKPDLFYFDAAGFGQHGTFLRGLGHKVIGASEWTDKLELDREFLFQMAKGCGIRVPETYHFGTPEAAVEFIKASPRRWVVRCAGEPLLISSDNEQMIAHLMRLPKDQAVEIQEAIFGNEIYTETWFDRGRNRFSFGAFENRHTIDGDLGQVAEPQTTAAWAYTMKEPRIVQLVIKKMYELIERSKYTGPLGFTCIVAEHDRKPYLISFRASSKRNMNAAREALLPAEFSMIAQEIMGSNATNEIRRPAYASGYGYTVAVSIPPYPSSPMSSPKLISLARGHAVGFQEGFMVNDVYMADGKILTAGTSGIVGDITSYGETIDAARVEAIRTLDKLVLTNKQARRGGGSSRFSRDLFRLAHFGFELPKSEVARA